MMTISRGRPTIFGKYLVIIDCTCALQWTWGRYTTIPRISWLCSLWDTSWNMWSSVMLQAIPIPTDLVCGKRKIECSGQERALVALLIISYLNIYTGASSNVSVSNSVHGLKVNNPQSTGRLSWYPSTSSASHSSSICKSHQSQATLL